MKKIQSVTSIMMNKKMWHDARYNLMIGHFYSLNLFTFFFKIQGRKGPNERFVMEEKKWRILSRAKVDIHNLKIHKFRLKNNRSQ